MGGVGTGLCQGQQRASASHRSPQHPRPHLPPPAPGLFSAPRSRSIQVQLPPKAPFILFPGIPSSSAFDGALRCQSLGSKLHENASGNNHDRVAPALQPLMSPPRRWEGTTTSATGSTSTRTSSTTSSTSAPATISPSLQEPRDLSGTVSIHDLECRSSMRGPEADWH